MKFLMVGILAMVLLGCDNTTSSSEPRVATKDEMITHYDKMSDGEIRQIFKKQNIGKCMSEFQAQQIPNASTACDCVMNNLTQQLPISDLKTMLLPAEYVSADAMNGVHNRSASAMVQATMSCARN